MYKLSILIASTRPGRKGPAIGSWIYDIAKNNPTFETHLLDLAIINLPFLDEPQHPRMQQYQHEHTKNWSKLIQESDAFIIVTPEYNFGFPASIKNALDFLFHEWTYKPVGFVSYGGIAGGTRAVQMLKQVVTAMKMMPVTEAVHLPFFSKYITAEEKFVPEQEVVTAAHGMLKELARWTGILQTMRKQTTS